MSSFETLNIASSLEFTSNRIMKSIKKNIVEKKIGNNVGFKKQDFAFDVKSKTSKNNKLSEKTQQLLMS